MENFLFITFWLLFCIICAYIFSLRAKKYSNAPYLDHPFFFGSAWDLQKFMPTIPDYILSYSLQFQKTFAMALIEVGLFPRGAIVLVRPEEVRYVLETNFENYIKGPNVIEGAQELVGNGIFSSDGSVWQFHRKVASRMFTKQIMQNSAEVMLSQTNKLISVLRNKTQSSVDIQDMFFRLTIDVFCEVAFGIQLNSVEMVETHDFVKAFDEVQFYCEKRFGNPFWRFGKLFGSPGERKIKNGVKLLNSFAETVINTKRRDAENGKNLGPDLISRFLDESKSKNETVSNKELRDIVMNFIIAGRDTTACALSWSIYELNRNPKVLEEVLNELQKNSSRENLASSSSLPYLHAVVCEVLRLHPSVPKQVKFAVKNDVFPDGTSIHAGMGVIYSSYALNRNPSIWEEPLSFKPERWLDPNSYPDHSPAIEPSTFKYVTFNAGRRICLGKGLALMEIKLVLAELLPQFSFDEKIPHTGEYNSTIVLSMKGGLHVSAIPRQTIQQ